MRFTKMHGIGNDYVYVNCFEVPFPKDPAALAVKISDRHFGVGSDGLILICPSDNGADARMRMYNADGSESEMCGNGLRCVAKFVYDHGIKRADKLRIQTGRGTLAVDLEIEGGKAARVRVNMGEPILEARQIPVELPHKAGQNQGKIVDVPIGGHVPLGEQAGWMQQCRCDDRMTCVSMGNPHVVVYCGSVAAIPLERIGPSFERATVFPKRINAHFVEVRTPQEVVMRTWERGSGITLACGTGACAVCVAGVLSGRTHRRIKAHLPGGDLDLEWSDADNCVYMTGPATEVFTGEWPDG